MTIDKLKKYFRRLESIYINRIEELTRQNKELSKQLKHSGKPTVDKDKLEKYRLYYLTGDKLELVGEIDLINRVKFRKVV